MDTRPFRVHVVDYFRALRQRAAHAGAAHSNAAAANKLFCTSWPSFRPVAAAQVDSSGGPLGPTQLMLTQLTLMYTQLMQLRSTQLDIRRRGTVQAGISAIAIDSCCWFSSTAMVVDLSSREIGDDMAKVVFQVETF